MSTVHPSRTQYSALSFIIIIASLLALFLLSGCEDKVVRYTLTLDGNGGTGNMEAVSLREDEATALPQNTYTKASHAFVGWSASKEASRAEYYDGSLFRIGRADVMLYAVWAENNTLTFNANGGEGNMEVQTIAKGQSNALFANRFTRKGYTFQGWAEAASGTVKYTDNEMYTMQKSDAITLYAIWAPNGHLITFHANDGSGDTYTQAMPDGVSDTLKANKFKRDGWVFCGWKTEENATDATYANEASYQMGDENVELWAKWIKCLVFSSPNAFTLKRDQWNWEVGSFSYSLDAFTWKYWDGREIASSSDGILYMRGSERSEVSSGSEYRWIINGSNVSISGNIETLLDYSKVESGAHPTMKEGCYKYMFYNCTALVSAPDLSAETLTKECYNEMFSGCTSLTSAPDLPATVLAESCYRAMFAGCTSLTKAPAMAATTLAPSCCENMFFKCTSLSSTPDLPAMTLARRCYASMFQGCSSLSTASALPSETMQESCYENMFLQCSALKRPPELSATVLASSCYSGMFSGCISLQSAPALTVMTLAPRCYNSMFANCPALSVAPVLPASVLSTSCYSLMFAGCSSLVKAPVLPATTLAESCYASMFSGCSRLTTIPELAVTALAPYCYSHMFSGCTSLTTTPTLPATELKDWCYAGMFKECTSLTAPPALPATTLSESCYDSMFYGCMSLISPPALHATTLQKKCYASMFKNCTSLASLPALPATTIESSCYDNMFQNCTKIKLSSSSGSSYLTAYCLPSSGTGSLGSSVTWWSSYMFAGTGGSFISVPSLNTTYYTSNTIVP